MESKILLGCAITLVITLPSFSQNTSRLYVPEETIYDTQNSEGGIGIDFDEPQHPLHILTSGERETSVKIDLEVLEVDEVGGGTNLLYPRNALIVDLINPNK